jgi:trigger factor
MVITDQGVPDRRSISQRQVERGSMTSIHVEDVSDVKKKVTIEVPEEKVFEVMDAQYKDLKKNVQLKGFRKGRVPLSILRSYFKSKVQADAARQIIEETLKPGLDEQNLTALSVTNIDSETLEEGKPFKYTAEIEIPPKIDVKGYKGLQLRKRIRPVTEALVEEQLQHLRERNARLAPLAEQRGITTGDHVVVDISATIDGEAVAALDVTDYHLEMGRNFYLPDFDASLEGMKLEETKDMTKDLPEDFPRKAIAGKTVQFRVTLKEAKEKKLPDLDDDFATDLGEFDSLDALKAKIRTDLETMTKNQTDRELETQIVDALLKENIFEVPESMIEAETDAFLHQSLQGLIAQGHDPDRLPMPTQAYRDQIRPGAVRAIQKALMYRSVAEQEGLKVTEEEITEDLQTRAKNLEISVDFLRDNLEKSERIDEVRETILYKKVAVLIQDNATITEEEVSSSSEETSPSGE